ncbi:transcriptional regulator [uncultured Mediterranean phage uvMED]|nr:transcriptional regulator [uncultured Mediterranean phage uvMED]
MDMDAQVHRATYPKIAYRLMERDFSGWDRANMQSAWADAVIRGDLCTPEELMERDTVSIKEWMGVLDIGVDCWAEHFPVLLMTETGIESMGLGAAYLVVAPDMRSVVTGFSLHWPNIDTNLTIDIENAKGGLNFRLYYHTLSGWVGACFNASAIGLFRKALIAVSGLRTGDGHTVTIHCDKPESGYLYEEHLKCPVTWEKRDDGKLGMTFFVPDHVLDRKNPHSDPAMYEYMSETLWQRTTAISKRAGESTSYTSLVRLTLSSSMKIPSQQEVADRHQWSVRSLQQNLKDEGSSWQELLDTEIINRAKVALSGGSSVDAAAASLGISPSNFRRKFKAVTGQTPNKYQANYD